MYHVKRIVFLLEEKTEKKRTNNNKYQMQKWSKWSICLSFQTNI